jgi:hypothetical protein
MAKQQKTAPETRTEQINRLIREYGIDRAGHSLFSPSSSAGWLNCKGFLLANAKKGDMAGYDAAYGTVGHAIAAEWLLTIRESGKKAGEQVPDKHLGTVIEHNGFKIEVDDLMLTHIRRYIDWCEEVELLGDVFIEHRVDYSEYTPIPNQGGTADHFVCVSPTKNSPGMLVITDLKMGMLRVDVEENSQALLYALGVYLEWNWLYKFERIIVRICQPRLDSFRVWECDAEYLLAFGERVREAADAAWRENAPRSPSQKACQWCADVACPARSKLLEDIADDTFDDDDVIEGKATPEYTAEELDEHTNKINPGGEMKEIVPRYTHEVETALMVWRFRQKALVMKFFEQIEAELLRRALAGEDLGFFKPGNGRKTLEWFDPDDAAIALSQLGVPEDKIFVTEVTSPSKAREALRTVGLKPKEIQGLFYGDEGLDEPVGLVKENLGKIKLVPVRSRSVDVRVAADEAFEDAEEEL